MDSEDKRFIILSVMGVIGFLLFCGMTFYSGYIENKLKLEQPKYFIEFKGDLYELKEVK